MRIATDDEKIKIGDQPPCLERPSVATCVSAQPRGGRGTRDAARARYEYTKRASIRRGGPATTERLDRGRSRGEQPNDSVEVAGPRRAWSRHARLSKARMGRRTNDASEARRFEWKPASSAQTSFISLFA